MSHTSIITLLTELRLQGLREALIQQEQQLDIYQDIAFYDRLQLLLEAEQLKRHNHRLSTRLRQARLHECVAMDTLDFTASRDLSKTLCMDLAKCEWVRKPQNILIVGATELAT
jgi:DNA replication protein DnaC